MTTPVFLFSLPRSGSTLVQRILALHPVVSTTAEPWLLLPYFYTLKPTGVYAEYAHFGVVKAMEDFCAVLPNGRADYDAEIRELALRLYTKVSHPSAIYFVDKTPRYHLIADEIIRVFPQAKFIFLWRNPLAVVASMIETWGKGHWNLYRYKIDLFTGLENLLLAYATCADRAYALSYEALLTDTVPECRRLFSYLDLQFDEQWLEDLSGLKFKGQMGDPVGVAAYHTVSKVPLEKWKSTLANPLRRAWCRHYLHWIGAHRLSQMGYDLDLLLEDLAKVRLNFRYMGSDLMNIGTSGARYLFEPQILKHQIQGICDWPNLHLHL